MVLLVNFASSLGAGLHFGEVVEDPLVNCFDRPLNLTGCRGVTSHRPGRCVPWHQRFSWPDGRLAGCMLALAKRGHRFAQQARSIRHAANRTHHAAYLTLNKTGGNRGSHRDNQHVLAQMVPHLAQKAPDLLRLQAEQDEVCIGNCLSVVRSRTDPIFFCDVFRSRFVGRRGKDSVHAGEQESTAAATPRETPS